MPATWRAVRPSRETRLLLITIAVAAGVLLILARYRFPAEPGPEPPAPPLERLAARATFDELASIIGRLEARILPYAVVLRVSSGFIEQSLSVTDLLEPRGMRDSPRFVAAIRVRPDVALAAVGRGAHIQSVVGDDDTVPVVLARDPVRGIAAVRVRAAGSGDGWRWAPESGQAAARYLVGADGTATGVALRPMFVGRATGFHDPKWDRPLVVLGAGGPGYGSLVFTLDARFVGLGVTDIGGMVAVVPAQEVARMAETLLAGHAESIGEIGIEVQPLSPAFARATGAQMGTVVSFVAPDAPAAGKLAVGDVIEAMDGQPVAGPEMLLIRIARARPGDTIPLRVVRQGERQDVDVAVRSFALQDEPGDELGLDLQAVARTGSRVTAVHPVGAAARAGIREGDVIVRIGKLGAPGPTAVARAYAATDAGGHLMVALRRGNRHLVTLIERR